MTPEDAAKMTFEEIMNYKVETVTKKAKYSETDSFAKNMTTEEHPIFLKKDGNAITSLKRQFTESHEKIIKSYEEISALLNDLGQARRRFWGENSVSSEVDDRVGKPPITESLAGVYLACLLSLIANGNLSIDSLYGGHNAQILNYKIMENLFREKIESRMDAIEAEIKKLLVVFKVSDEASSVESSGPLPSTEKPIVYRRFEWGDRIHDFPEDFKIPSFTSSQMWHLWLFGDSNNVNIPYRMLKGQYMPQTERSQLSKIKVVMETMREKIGMSYDEIAALGHVEAERLFNIAYLDVFGHCRFHNSMKCTNAYKHIWRIRRNSKKNLDNKK